MSIEYDLKQKLCEIIEYAYKDSDNPKKERFTWFHLKIKTKKLKSKSGHHDWNKHEIVIYDALALEANNISTLLHEVAHHIDWVINGKSGHQKEFYEIFKTLLYSAMDLGYVSLEDLQGMDHRNTDYNKVMKMLNDYVPSIPKEPKEEKYQLKVMNSFSIKDELKKNGYFFNNLSKSWDKSNFSMDAATIEQSRLIEKYDVNPDDIEIVSMKKFNFGSKK